MSAPRLFSHSRPTRALAGTRAILPGLGLCVAVTAAAIGFEAAEAHLFGRAWLEALVLAILLGSAIRTIWTPSQRFFPGIAFGAKTVLEIAVVLLGASLSLAPRESTRTTGPSI
ncbi:MAG: putative sulfate exporter family transporter, partial [Propionibacteriaceae bacterium]